MEAQFTEPRHQTRVHSRSRGYEAKNLVTIRNFSGLVAEYLGGVHEIFEMDSLLVYMCTYIVILSNMVATNIKNILR